MEFLELFKLLQDQNTAATAEQNSQAIAQLAETMQDVTIKFGTSIMTQFVLFAGLVAYMVILTFRQKKIEKSIRLLNSKSQVNL